MAKNRIGRRIKKTICECDVVNEQKEVVEKTVTLYGDYDLDTAQRRVRAKLKTNNALVKSVTHESFYASQPLSVFVANCDLITDYQTED